MSSPQSARSRGTTTTSNGSPPHVHATARPFTPLRRHTPVTQRETLDEFRYAARILRDLRAAYTCLRDGHPRSNDLELNKQPARRRRMPASFELGADRRDRRAQPHTRTTARPLLGTDSHLALRSFHPRLNLTAPPGRPEHGWLAGANVSPLRHLLPRTVQPHRRKRHLPTLRQRNLPTTLRPPTRPRPPQPTPPPRHQRLLRQLRPSPSPTRLPPTPTQPQPMTPSHDSAP